MDTDDLAEWTPIAIRWEEPEPVIKWCRLGERRFVEPFFDQTIHNWRNDPDYRHGLRVTPAQALNDLQESMPGPPPAGFIFHASRCGSTLVAQMLASIARNRVLSEPDILDSLLAAARRSSLTGDRTLRLLRGIVGALGRPPRQPERSYFVKFSSAAILAMPLIRRAFPDVPWVFLYRDPLEILGAQLHVTGDRLPPGLAQAGLLDGDPAEFERMPPADFWARVLVSRCAAALEWYQPGRTLLLNYPQLPGAVWEILRPFFGATCSPEDIERMRSAATRNAKAPSRSFVADSDRKRRAVTPAVHALVDSLVMPLYRRLESIRIEGN